MKIQRQEAGLNSRELYCFAILDDKPGWYFCTEVCETYKEYIAAVGVGIWYTLFSFAHQRIIIAYTGWCARSLIEHDSNYTKGC